MLTEDQVSEALEELGWRGDVLFESRENRDQVWRAAKAAEPGKQLRIRSTGHQLLDPQYVFEHRAPDQGLNNAYRTSWANLYGLSMK